MDIYEMDPKDKRKGGRGASKGWERQGITLPCKGSCNSNNNNNDNSNNDDVYYHSKNSVQEVPKAPRQSNVVQYLNKFYGWTWADTCLCGFARLLPHGTASCRGAVRRPVRNLQGPRQWPVEHRSAHCQTLGGWGWQVRAPALSEFVCPTFSPSFSVVCHPAP